MLRKSQPDFSVMLRKLTLKQNDGFLIKKRVITFSCATENIIAL